MIELIKQIFTVQNTMIVTLVGILLIFIFSIILNISGEGNK